MCPDGRAKARLKYYQKSVSRTRFFCASINRIIHKNIYFNSRNQSKNSKNKPGYRIRTNSGITEYREMAIMLLRQVVLRMQVAQGKDGTIYVRPAVYNPRTIDPETLVWDPDAVGQKAGYKGGQWWGIGVRTDKNPKTREEEKIYFPAMRNPERMAMELEGWLMDAARMAVKELVVDTMDDTENGRILEDIK